MSRALSWTQDARRARRGIDVAMTGEQVKSLNSARMTEHLESGLRRWQAAAAAIADAFDPARRTELNTEVDEPGSRG